MIGSILVLTVSLILFLYWFRYTCLLILSARPAKDYGRQVAEANQLSFPEIRDELRGATAASVSLAKLETSLERDFRLLNCLISQAAESPLGGLALEERILLVDYKIMKAWCKLTRPIAVSQARRALEEMSDIVAHFANVTGERQAVPVTTR
jgi:hypothetical protein